MRALTAVHYIGRLLSYCAHFFLPFLASDVNFFAPYFLRPMYAASAPGFDAPFAASDLLNDLKRAPLPSFGFFAMIHRNSSTKSTMSNTRPRPPLGQYP